MRLPTILHAVEPLGSVRFYVEFHHRIADRTAKTIEVVAPGDR